MSVKPIVVSGIVGGMVLTGFDGFAQFVAQIVAPYNIFDIGGMRPPDDPLLGLFFFYPFVLAFAAAILFRLLRGVLEGTLLERGLKFGLILIILVTIPSLFIIFSTMLYPTGFYIANLLTAILGFPSLGVIYSKIWEKCE